MFDLDEFVASCQVAIKEAEPRIAIKELLDRTMSEPGTVGDALPVTRAEIVPLYATDDLSILKVVWAPGMRIAPHNHLMWASIGIYAGQEDNEFFRRADGTITPSGGRELKVGDVVLLGDDTIHAVTNPLSKLTAAIHVYGGDITAGTGRSEWDDETHAEIPYTFERTQRLFEQANAEMQQ